MDWSLERHGRIRFSLAASFGESSAVGHYPLGCLRCGLEASGDILMLHQNGPTWLIFVMIAVWLCLVGGIGYVALHFIIKFW